MNGQGKADLNANQQYCSSVRKNNSLYLGSSALELIQPLSNDLNLASSHILSAHCKMHMKSIVCCLGYGWCRKSVI